MEEKEKESLSKSISKLSEMIEKMMSKRYFRIIDSSWRFLFYNFLAGLAKGLGFMVGASLVFALLIWILSKLSLIPVIGDWVKALLYYIKTTQ
jgi:hypothetical protein